MKNFIVYSLSAVLLFLATGTIAAEQSKDLDSLLKRLEQGMSQQTSENKKREQEFVNKRAQQDALLKDATAKRDAQNAISAAREEAAKENNLKIDDLEVLLNERLGSLKELFGTLQQVAGKTSSSFQTSIVSAELPGREDFLAGLAKKMGSSSELATIEEIEKLWFEMQREMIKSGEVVRFDRPVIAANGEKQTQTVTRVGTFSLVSNGKYLDYTPETGSIVEMQRQPSERFTSTISALESGNGAIVGIALDPTGGSILRLLIQAPELVEYIEFGGIPGYIIILIGVLALLVSLERSISLLLTERKVKSQLKSNTLSDNNPLGRVLQVKDKFKSVAFDTLELKLGEAILKEIPKITRNITFVKIISVVAPLLGLLGTVTGMIITFQQITLFGTGDPQMMANGIQQALVTTVLGLVVAIPTVLLYTWLNSRSKKIVHILQEQSAGIIAERAEQGA